MGDTVGPDRAIVIDELALVRRGIGAVLHDQGIDLTASTRSAREAASRAILEHPTLVVCGAPADFAVADAVRRLTALRPRPAVVALVPPAQDHVVSYLLAMGASVGLRSGEADELGGLIDAALNGGTHVAPGLHAALPGRVKLPPLAERTEAVLSGREREVLVLLGEGRSNREIAAALSVTLATVKSHLVRIYGKLEASNRNEALGRAVSLGLLR